MRCGEVSPQSSQRAGNGIAIHWFPENKSTEGYRGSHIYAHELNRLERTPGYFSNDFHFLFEATGERSEKGRRQALEKRLEGRVLWGPFSGPLTRCPWRRQLLGQPLLPGNQKTAISEESNHLIIRLTDNTSTPFMVYLFTYYFNTLLNLFIKWENWSFKSQKDDGLEGQVCLPLFKIIQLFHFYIVAGTCSLKHNWLIDKQTGKKDKTNDLHTVFVFSEFFLCIAGR